jgi:hypothetical protein
LSIITHTGLELSEHADLLEAVELAGVVDDPQRCGRAPRSWREDVALPTFEHGAGKRGLNDQRGVVVAMGQVTALANQLNAGWRTPSGPR